MTEQETKPRNEQDPPGSSSESQLKKKIEGIKEEYKRLFLGIGMALMFIYSIYLLCNTFIK